MKATFNIFAIIVFLSVWTISGCTSDSVDSTSKDSTLQNTIFSVDSTINNSVDQDTSAGNLKNIFPLPLISSVKFLHTKTSLEHLYLKYISHFEDSLSKFLKYYNREYPDIGKYKVYYVIVYCSQDSTAKCICSDANGEFFGLLILYDQNSSQANIINVSYSVSPESEHYEMSFLIDNNTITLIETGETEGDGPGGAEPLGEWKVVIKVSKDGEIHISDRLLK